jgi:ATP-dependent DNA helicase RecQ
MIATSAFGMGIDKPNIRYIIHYQAPGSLEQYVQEAGRAGRDGKPARCILLFDEADLEIQRHLSARSKPGLLQAREDARRLAALEAYANTDECRSVFIRRYFGEADPPRCGRCDRCRRGREGVDEDDALREITQAGLRGEARVGERLPEREREDRPVSQSKRKRRGRGRRRR